MTRLAALLLLLLLGAGSPGSDADPPGTVPLSIEVGSSAPIPGPPGANLLCDDTSVVAPRFSADGNGFELAALKRGSTLCGLWLAGQTPGGLFRVTVVAKPK
jgi:hypothetical protein